MKYFWWTSLLVVGSALSSVESQSAGDFRCLVEELEQSCWFKMNKYVYNSKTRSCRKERVCWKAGFFNKARCEDLCAPKDQQQPSTTCANVRCGSGTVCIIMNGVVKCVGGGDDNSDRPKAAPNLCLLSAASGPCLAYMPSYFYNSKSGKCESFVYGGCGGNKNRFGTKISCERVCIKKTATPQSCPELPPGTIGLCVEDCFTDEDCSEGTKCCSNGCGHSCMAF